MALSLKRAGALNSSRIQAASDRLVDGDRTGTISRFRALASDSAFSTNVSADKVEVFDEHGEILDARAVKLHHAGGDETAASLAFAAEQDSRGQWLVRRTGFESLWRGGHGLVYGAVNAGGMGAEDPRYGPFCLVIEDPASRADEIAVFPSNSAERYCSESGEVDRELARSEAVTWRNREHLATVERAGDVPGTPPEAWPHLVCSPSRYLEAVVTPGPPLESVDAVRVRDGYLARLADLTVAGSQDPLEAATEQRELNAIEIVRRWRADYGITIEAVG